MKKTLLIILLFNISSFGGLFGDTEEEKTEFQNKMFNNMIKGFTLGTIDLKTKKEKELIKKKITKEKTEEREEKKEKAEREKAKKELLIQMQN